MSNSDGEAPRARELEAAASQLQREGRYAEAEGPLLAAIDIWRRLRGPDDIEVLNDEMNLGIAYRRAGQAARAVALLDSVAQRMRASRDPDAPDLWKRCVNALAVAFRDAGQMNAARAAFDACLATFDPAVPSDERARVLDNISALLADDEPADAERYARRAHAEWVALRGEADLDTAISKVAIGTALMRQDKLADARAFFAEAEPVIRALGDHPRVGELECLVGELEMRHRQLALAASHTEAGLAIFRRFFPEAHPEVQRALRNLAALARMGEA